MWPAAKMPGRKNPSVNAAGIAPITRLDAPSRWANAGMTVDDETRLRAKTNRTKSHEIVK